MNGRRLAFAFVVVTALTSSAPSWAQFSLATPDGKSSLKLGALAQIQAESLDNADATATARNIFLRRARILIGGKLGDRVSLFLETDSPNLGKAGADGRKNEGTMYVQDLVVTYAVAKSFKLDGGLLLVPLSHHSNQAATTLLGVDYGSYAFLPSSPTQCRVGRDYGLQGRGYLFSQHLELRGGVFQGARGTDATASFRTIARAVVHVLEPETDFFYTGTTLGTRRLLSFGASYDRQKGYETVAGDVFFDHPIGGGNAVTAQFDYWHTDGGAFLTDLPRQNVWFAEAALYIAPLKLSPFVQLNARDYADVTRSDESFQQLGLAYWTPGFKFNVKVGVGRVLRDNAPDRTQLLAQVQLLLW
jgi:hypothetical protein